MRRLLLALLASASSAALAAQQPATLTIDPAQTPEVLQALDSSGTWVPLGSVDQTNHAFSSNGLTNMATFPGVDPTGATDSSAAVNTAAATGASLYFPAGSYQFASLNLTQNQRVFCEAPNRTLLQQNSTTGDFITMSGWYNSVQHCQLQPTVRVSGYQIVAQHSCFQCSAIDLWINNHFNTINAQQGNMLTLRDILVGSMYGPIGVEFAGTSGARANNLNMYNVLFNNAYPVAFPAPGTPIVATWAASATFQQGQVVHVNGVIYQETAAGPCTSASSGSGPSGFPAGTTPQSIWSGRIADGTCQWGFESNSLIGLDWGNYANSVTAYDFAVLNNLTSVRMTDAINTGGSLNFVYPAFGNFVNLTGDHTFWSTFDGEGGGFVQLTNVYAGSSLNLNAVQTGGNFIGDLKVIGGRVADNWGSGVFFAAGVQLTVDGASVGSNSQAGAGVHNNIEIAAGVSNFSITNNKVGRDAGAGPSVGNLANWGVVVNAGTSDYYVVTGNTCAGNVQQAACVIDGGTGTHKTVSGNW